MTIACSARNARDSCPDTTWGAGATPTGLRERHNRSSKIRRKDMAGGSEEPIIIGLAIAVIIGTGIVCLIDALKNKLK
jgi:hypothetical protein